MNPREEMRNNFFKSSSPLSSSSTITPPRSPVHIVSESVMDENVDVAESVITKWDSDSSSYAGITSLFRDNRYEAKEFVKSVKDLQTAMHFFASTNMSSVKLIRAQTLMQIAMKRLQKEFYQILSANKKSLDPESVSTRSSMSSARFSSSDFEEETDEDFRFANESVSEAERVSRTAVADLKAIADCMISSGYARECVNLYKVIRKSVIDEGLYRLGIEKFSSSEVNKMDWAHLEKKMKNWLNAVKMAMKTLFDGERILCDRVFSASQSIIESCFTEISKEGAVNLFAFPELVTKHKKTPEKIFVYLDIYGAITDLWPEIESIFSFESTSTVRSLALNSLTKLAEAVRSMIADFESAIQKDSSKSPVPGGGIHPLTRYVMNYVSFLTDYSEILTYIFADWPLVLNAPLPEGFDSDDNPITIRLAWLILVLVCKLDGKAELYNDVALSYIFLANNLQYVVVKVQSSNLKFLLGDDWITKHQQKIKQYRLTYERMGWSKVFSTLPADPTANISTAEARECFGKFGVAFEETYRKQTSWIVSDSKLRDEIKLSLSKKVGSLYGEFYENHRDRFTSGSISVVKLTPSDIQNYLSDLFCGPKGGSGSVSSSSSSSSSSHHLGAKGHHDI